VTLQFWISFDLRTYLGWAAKHPGTLPILFPKTVHSSFPTPHKSVRGDISNPAICRQIAESFWSVGDVLWESGAGLVEDMLKRFHVHRMVVEKRESFFGYFCLWGFLCIYSTFQIHHQTLGRFPSCCLCTARATECSCHWSIYFLDPRILAEYQAGEHTFRKRMDGASSSISSYWCNGWHPDS